HSIRNPFFSRLRVSQRARSGSSSTSRIRMAVSRGRQHQRNKSVARPLCHSNRMKHDVKKGGMRSSGSAPFHKESGVFEYRYLAFAVCASALIVSGLGVLAWGWHWGAVVVPLLLTGVVVYDVLRRRHAVLRISPLTRHLRYPIYTCR